MIKRRKKLMAEVLVLTICTSTMPATIALASDTATNQAASTTQVSLSQSVLNCVVGEHKTLTATTTPSAVSVSWSSSKYNKFEFQ